MSGALSLKRSNGVRNGKRIDHASLYGSAIRVAHIPNFDLVKQYIEFISIEYDILLSHEQDEIYEPVVIDIETMIERCNLGYKNPLHLLMIITEDGKYGEFQRNTTSANLTKQALVNLILILQQNTQEFFLLKNQISVSDIQKRPSNGIIFDKKSLTYLIISRGFHHIIGLSASQIVTGISTSFEEGLHFRRAKLNRANSPNTIILTSAGVEYIVLRINEQVSSALYPDTIIEQIKG